MNIEGAIQVIAQQMLNFLDAKRCSIRSPDGKKIVALGVEAENSRLEIAMDASTVAGQAITSRRIVYIPDIKDSGYYDPLYIQSEALRALLAIPLMVDEEIFGVAQIYRQEPFKEEDISLAGALAGSAALTLYHIEASKMSRRAIRDVVDALFECPSVQEIFRRAVDIIAKRLEIESCLIYKVFPRFESKELWCEIVAGVPPDEHEIGFSEKLAKHPDIGLAVESGEIQIMDFFLHEKTQHLHDLAKKKENHVGMYVPLILNGENSKEKPPSVMGVMVLEARKKKMGFSAEEKSFAFDVGRIIGRLIERDLIRDEKTNTLFKEIEHMIVNPSLAMAGFAERTFEPILQIQETAEQFCKHSASCKGANLISSASDLILKNAVKVVVAAKNITAKVSNFRQTRIFESNH